MTEPEVCGELAPAVKGLGQEHVGPFTVGLARLGIGGLQRVAAAERLRDVRKHIGTTDEVDCHRPP